MKKMKKNIIALLMAIAMVANYLSAFTIKASAVETGTCGDDIRWEINEWGALYIWGYGDMPDFSPEEPAPWAEYLPEGQLYVEISGDITSIGAYAFYGYNGSLTVDTQYSAVMSIGAYAFAECIFLNEVRLNDSIFSIGEYAFYNCSSLQEMPRLDLLMSIGDYAFYNCQNLYAFPLGSSLSTVGNYAFCETYSLESVTFPASLTYLGDGAFGCSSIRTVTFEGPAPQIDRWAFNSTYADAYYDPQQDGWAYFDFNNIQCLTWYPIGGSSSPVLGAGACGDNLTWNLTQDGVMTISGTGRMTEFLGIDPPWLGFKDQITSVVVEDGVEYIGREAFNGCSNLWDVTVADSVQGIGIHAFDNTPWLEYQPDGLVYLGKVVYTYKGTCPSTIAFMYGTVGVAGQAFENVETLENVIFPATIREIGFWAFKNCVNLKEINLNDGVAILDECAFSGCDSVTEIVIPDSVTTMKSGAFASCANVERIVIGNGVTDLGYSTFSYSESLKEVVIGSNVQSISNSAFRGCTALESIQLPASVKVIEDHAFFDCYALKSITMPNVTRILYYAFANCKALEKVEFPETLKELGVSVFAGCSGLTSVQIPDSVTIMDAGCFNNCAALTEVYIGKGVSQLDSQAFLNCTALSAIHISPENQYYMSDSCGVLYTKDGKTLEIYPVGRVGAYTVANTTTKISRTAFGNCPGLTAVTLPEGLERIEYGAFAECVNLKEVRIPNSVTRTEGGTFLDCTALETVWIGNGLKMISATMFANCTALKEVHLSEGLEVISSSAFENCTGLTAITLPNSVTEISYEAFSGCTNLKDVVLSGNLREIGSLAFYNCKSLQEIYIPDSVTNIGYSAFNSCKGLVTVKLSKNMKTIKDHLFYVCNALKTIEIPASVTTIDTDAFAGCRSLEYVQYTGTLNEWEAIDVKSGNTYLTNAMMCIVPCSHFVWENNTCAVCGSVMVATAYNSAGEEVGYYSSLEDIQNFAAEGQTIVLQKDVVEIADIVIIPGVTLDLNGHSLTVNSVLTYAGGGIVDNSEKDTGVLMIRDAKGNMISQNNAQLPVYDEAAGGLRFFAVAVESVAVTGKTEPKYWFKVTVENFDELYKLMGAVNIKANLSWNGGEAEATASAEFMNKWAEKYASGDDFYITVCAVNTQGLENFTLTPCVTANGVEICGKAL